MEKQFRLDEIFMDNYGSLISIHIGFDAEDVDLETDTSIKKIESDCEEFIVQLREKYKKKIVGVE